MNRFAAALALTCCFACDAELTVGVASLEIDPNVAAPGYRTRGPIFGEFQGANIWNHTVCNQWNQLVYYQPAGPGPFPIAVYLPGTSTYPEDPITHFTLRMLAEGGYVAVAMDYGQDHWYCAFGCYCYKSKADCVFDPAHPNSVIGVLEQTTGADSSLGIVAWGHSQGGYMAAMSGDLNGDVVRALATGAANPGGDGYSECMLPGVRGLASDKLRLVMGEYDEVTDPHQADDAGEVPGIRSQLAELTEQPECAAPPTNSCLRANGSGFYIVTGAEVSDGHAEHSFFIDANDEGGDLEMLDDLYVGDPSVPWGAEASANWLLGVE